MLDLETRRRIDTARDILVGKVPDPKSQVEQITFALIYKFMDDMDAEAEELGGERAFFTGEFARYRWPVLLHSGLGGHETLNRYEEAIRRMGRNDGLPPLFRDIFDNAALPYRDPATLREFLRVIDRFEYDHSERLGDAFEYLLSIMGAQGDAGQFRTPRHLIDFIVAVLDPQKHESVLDPACGTAGFLVSAWKHVRAAAAGADGAGALTPDERARIADGFRGYDISPDMVRLSRVNLYLHGFARPAVHEYDTLTSDERWNERADVILANPPFMSPRGGIRPHARFSIDSKRSEALFVDYIAEHLNPGGRAGVIVPEGVVFQRQKAYRQLRRLLLDECLVAVVSLPAGVFKPYSGVKTSILLLDRALARRADGVAFLRIANDGFELGDQRRPIEGGQLERARAEIAEYLRRLRAGESLEGWDSELGWIVPRERIAADANCDLSGERYREVSIGTTDWPLVPLGEVCTINPRKSLLRDVALDTRVSFVPMSDLGEHRIQFQPQQEKALEDVLDAYTYFADNDVLVAKMGVCFENGKAGIARDLVNGIGFGSSEFYVLRCTEGGGGGAGCSARMDLLLCHASGIPRSRNCTDDGHESSADTPVLCE